MTRPRVLLAASEPPGAGGSGTAAIDLFQRMRADGWDAHFVHILDEIDAACYQVAFGGALGELGDLLNTHVCCIREASAGPHPELEKIVASVGADLAIGCGFRATEMLRRAAPGLRLIFMTATCRQAQDLVTRGDARDAMALEAGLAQGTFVPRIVNPRERVAVEHSDLVITHSPMTHLQFERFFIDWLGKVYPVPISFAEWIADGAHQWRHLARPFDERDIDVLFVASDWARTEKNYTLVRSLVRRLDGLRVHVVGTVPFRLPGATHHGFVPDRQALFQIVGRTRVITCPSLIDAAPGILFEGAVMGCNLVASKNCGNWQVCHPALVAPSCTADAFAGCIRKAAERKLADHLDAFRDAGGYRTLMAVISAFARPFEATAAS
jgi:hypothetical protein